MNFALICKALSILTTVGALALSALLLKEVSGEAAIERERIAQPLLLAGGTKR